MPPEDSYSSTCVYTPTGTAVHGKDRHWLPASPGIQCISEPERNNQRKQKCSLWFSQFPSKHLLQQCCLKLGDLRNAQGLVKIHGALSVYSTRHCATYHSEPSGQKAMPLRQLWSRGEIRFTKLQDRRGGEEYCGGKQITEGRSRGKHCGGQGKGYAFQRNDQGLFH